MSNKRFTLNEFSPRTWVDEGKFYDNLPEASKDLVDDLAVSVLGGSGKVIIVGYPSSGKTYLLEQFISNLSRYAKRAPIRKRPTFLKIDMQMWMEIEELGGINRYVELIEKHYEKTTSNLCFITEFPQIAEQLAYRFPKSSVILETNLQTYRALIQSEDQGTSKTWSSWRTINANLSLSKVDLVTALHYSLVNEFFNDFGEKITKKEITSFVTYFMNNASFLRDTSEKQKVKCTAPPGLWAYPLRRYIGLKTYAKERFETKSGNFSMVSAIKNVFEKSIEEMRHLMGQNPFEGAGQITLEGVPKEIEEAIMLAIASNVNEHEHSEKGAVKKVEYTPIETLEKRLSSVVVGQDAAVKKVSEGMFVPAAGLNDPSKPLRSFLFLGPTGVGKTKLALTLAEQLTVSPMNVVRLDMSEYALEHEVAKLFGSPPGFAAHDEGGVLTNAVKEHPNSLVLLDEIEKAHPKVYDQFLQVLDSGRMTSGSGETIDFTKTVVIMTSNLGVKELDYRGTGFSFLSHKEEYEARQSKAETIITKAVEQRFTPEFINRIDERVIFSELSEDTITKIVSKEIDVISERLKGRANLSSPDGDILKWILGRSETRKYGAREIQRIIAQEVATPVARFILGKNATKNIRLALRGESIEVEGVSNG